MNFLGFGGTNASIDIKIEGLENRKHTTIREKNCDPKKLPVYIGDDDISGTIDVKLSKGKKLEHLGIRVELIGHIEILYDKNQSSDFMNMGKELEPAGFLYEDKTYKFMFAKFDKEVESYVGNSAKLRYFLRVTINKSMG